MNAGLLVSNARSASGHTVRALAHEADVAGSTITRIQSGAVDPSVQTLERILDAAGFTLQITAIRHGTPPRPRLADITHAWTHHRGRVRLNWTTWRTLLDELALHPELIPEAIYPAPPPTGEHIIDALLAAIAEKLADDAHLPRPAWTTLAPTLRDPYTPPTARTVTDRAIPPQLAARGLMIDTTSLWRDRATVDA